MDEQDKQARVNKAHERLAFLEKRYRSLFREAPVMYVITRNVDGTPLIEDCNQRFLETLGFDLEEVLGRTRAMYVDITERKSAEESLRRSEAKYRTLFENSPDAIFVSTPEGRLLDINRAGVELFGFDSRDEILKTTSKNPFTAIHRNGNG